jgi:hypothetical protein
MRPQRAPHPRLFGALASVVFVAAACGSAAVPATPSANPAAATFEPSPRFQPATGDGPEAMLVVGRTGQAGLELVRARTGESLMNVPAGAPDPAWKRIVITSLVGTETVVQDLAMDGDGSGSQLDIEGLWRLPTIGTDRVPVGVSADGSTIALIPTEDAAATTPAGTSRFAILRHVAGDRPTTNRDAELRLANLIELQGAFEFDALSPDGNVLYVVQHLAGEEGAYQVRAVDVPTGRLREAVIVDKRQIDETMAGWPIAQVRRQDGIVLTLYRGAEHPFVHALNTIDAWAVCLDLPGGGASNEAASRDWGLAPSADGRTVYAINGSLGVAAEIDPTELTIRRTALLRVTTTSSIVLAKLGHGPIGPAGTVVVSPDGKIVWAAGTGGVVAIDTATLEVNRRILDGTAVDGVAVMPDGSAMFALLHNGGRIVALDPGTGQSIGSVPGGGFDRLLAAAPG